MKEQFRKMFLDALNRQMKSETGISTRTNLYMVEVQMVKDLMSVFTGCDIDEDHFHDLACDTLDKFHHHFDC